MKILFLVSSMHAGGAERVAATLSGGWVNQGHEVILAPTYTGKGKLFYELHPEVRLEWVADRLGRVGRTPLAPFVKLLALRRMVREHRPDVIVSFLTNVNVMALMATRGLGVPVIVCERTNPAVSTSASTALQRLRRRLYPYADMVTVQAQASLAAMRELVPGMKRLAVVPNPLPPGLPAAASATVTNGNPNKRYRLVAMGRFVASKRYGLLLDVFERLAPRFPDWDLAIWGDGPLRETLAARVIESGLEGRVMLPGRTAEPWQELLASDLFVMTSEVEGFPNALIEAMALGLPCVTVNCPSGPEEITREGRDARLVPLNDEAALEAALAQLMSNADARLQLGRQGAASVRERYGLQHVLKLWNDLFRELGLPQP